MKSNIFSEDFDLKEIQEFEKQDKINAPELYEFPDGLLNAVKVAIFLGQPLLITGEPGTGKTELAAAVAKKFGMQDKEQEQVPEQEQVLFVFNAKTTSTAKDLFYIYDSLGHFQYNQNNKNEVLTPDQIEENFITYQALGKAIKQKGQRSIVLIDEIDKAPRDLPNDILNEIDKLEFEVPEIKRTDNNKYKADEKFRPIIIMTSNSEKNLPDAFLRRCIFFHIEFPDAKTLTKILKKKILDVEYSDKQWVEILDHFYLIRDNKVKRKKPATAELIYWVSILSRNNFDVGKLKDVSKLNKEEKEILNMSYSILAKNADDLKAILVS